MSPRDSPFDYFPTSKQRARIGHEPGAAAVAVGSWWSVPRALLQNRAVFNFGIPGYTPEWMEGKATIAARHGSRLRALSGRPLGGIWLAWDLDEDAWFTDCPVLLDFAGERLEVNHWKLSELSLTWDSIDPGAPIHWPGSEDTHRFHLAWRREPLPGLAELRDQRLDAVELLEWAGHDLANGTVAMGFRFEAAYLTIYNALDENGIELGAPQRDYRRTSIIDL